MQASACADIWHPALPHHALVVSSAHNGRHIRHISRRDRSAPCCTAAHARFASQSIPHVNEQDPASIYELATQRARRTRTCMQERPEEPKRKSCKHSELAKRITEGYQSRHLYAARPRLQCCEQIRNGSQTRAQVEALGIQSHHGSHCPRNRRGSCARNPRSCSDIWAMCGKICTNSFGLW